MDIPRIRNNRVRLRDLFRGESQKTSGSEGQGYRLFFRRTPQEEYTFENGKILLNGADVDTLVESAESDIGLLVGLSGGLEEYRRNVWLRYGTDRRDFNMRTQGVLEKILGKLTHIYEEMSGGVRVQMQAGRLWINDIDPKMVLALFLSNPTEERRRYLESVQSKLTLILAGKIGKSLSHGILEETRRVHHQIQTALDNQTAGSVDRLLPAAVHLHR